MVALDVIIPTGVIRHPLTGIGVYTLELIKALNALEDKTFGAIGCYDRGMLVDLDSILAEEIEDRQLDISAKQTITNFGRKALLRFPQLVRLLEPITNRPFKDLAEKSGFPLYHEPNFVARPYEGRSVVTIHDLSFIRFPNAHPEERVAASMYHLPRTVERVDQIITDSQVVADDLESLYPAARGKTTAIHLAANDDFHPRDDLEVQTVFDDFELSELGLESGNYVLYVGTIEPRKGVDRLLAAWKSVPEYVKRDFKLVICGSYGWGGSALLEEIEAEQDRGQIVYLGFVSPLLLPVLYAGAACFVYPSLYEGFGMPVLEAMQSGCPTITRGGTSMSEFAGEASWCVTSDHADDWSHALTTLLTDAAALQHYRQASLSKAAEFSWSRVARETISVYKTALSK